MSGVRKAEEAVARDGVPVVGRQRIRAGMWTAGVIGAVLLPLAAYTYWSGNGPADDTLTGAVAGARIDDPHPVGRPVTGIHPDCGVPEGTVRALAGDVRPSAPVSSPNTALERRCVWRDEEGGVGEGGAGEGGVLDVEVRVFEAEDGDPDRAAAAGVRGLADLLTWELRDHPEAEVAEFTGLGEQAYLVHGVRGVHRDEETPGTAVFFRSANTVVRVAHRGESPELPPGLDPGLDLGLDPGGGENGDEGKAGGGGDGAVFAAAAIADGLGAVAGPLTAFEHEPETRDGLPDRCPDLPHPREPERTEEAYLVETARFGETEIPQASCEWPGPEYIDVDTVLLPTAVDARGEYLYLFHRERAAPRPDGADDPAPTHVFVPVDGPGDEAFAVYTREDDDSWKAQVVFRDGGLLVRVTGLYFYPDRGQGAGEVLDRFYGFAEEAARSIRS
ncbi:MULTISPECIES: hypothetical protein [unclassified Nocardiopsis]|uniref:hypothetical protein n=1 Tax=Nocardiopsis TaxID=2013 RepID=UPI00387B278D